MILLASTSPRRIESLKSLNLEFKSIKPMADEVLIEGLNPLLQVQQLAFQKALSVVNEEHDLIISGDTIVVFENELLGKPHDFNDAIEMLTKLNGKTHKVITGLCVLKEVHSITRAVVSEVSLKQVTQEVIETYIEKHQPFDKAGSYGIQDEYFKDNILDSYSGYLSTIIGFPIEVLQEMMKEIEYDSSI